MKSFITAAFLAAASTLSLQADFLDSPLVRVTPELDLLFTAQARVEYDDNLFLGRNGNLPGDAAYYDLIPGLEFQYGKDLPLTGTLAVSRRYRTFFDALLRQLDDEQDAGQFQLTYDGGGPLRVDLAASYSESARNTAEEIALLPGSFQGSLVRQTGYSQSFKAGYKFTERTTGSIGVSLSSNRYDPRFFDDDANPLTPDVANTQGLTEADGWNVPLNLSYKVSEKLSLGVALSHGNTDTRAARGSTASAAPDVLVRNFYGLTFNYAASDKMMYEIQAGLLDSEFKSSGFARQSPSFSLRISHMLTEKMDHALTIGQDATVAPNGALSDSLQLAYDINYNNSEAFRTFARLNYTQSTVESFVSSTDIETAGASLGASYTLDTHWSFAFLYTYSVTLNPGDYDVNRVSLEASFRW